MSGAEGQPTAEAPVTQQPGGLGFSDVRRTDGSSAGALTTPEGITVRYLRDDEEDADFAARLTVEAFRGKVVYAAGENK